MPPREPFTFPKMRQRLTTMHQALKQPRPHIGVTQGGSSRKHAGAKPAATDGLHRPQDFEQPTRSDVDE